MAHEIPEFEVQDIKGKSLVFTGTALLANINVPGTTVNGRIESFLVHCLSSNAVARRLFVSIDGGAAFFELSPGESWTWTLKNNNSNAAITQLVVKGNNASLTTAYQVVINHAG